MSEEYVQRRLAAILAADVVGYSRLMREDEEGTLAALNTHIAELIEPCVARHRGRIVKTTGDGLLAEFASVVDAIRCAVAFQEGMLSRNESVPEGRRMMFRIGVNIGDVIVQDGDVFGDGVNIAARLEALATPGSVVVSGSVQEQLRGKVDLRFDDLGLQSIKNIAEPIRAFRIRRQDDQMDAVRRDAGPPPLVTSKPSIAVLPFQNMSGDPEQEYFSDGISEDLISALSRIRWFFVTARNSSFSYKGSSPDVRDVARALGVRYVLEGSVRKSANRVRVTAQLIDGASGNHVWAERYDREIHDVFDLQDEMTERIVGAIEPAISRAEIHRARSKRTDNLDAWDLCQRGWWSRYRNGREDLVAARACFEHALDLDPDFVSASAGMAEVLSYMVLFDYAHDPAAQVADAIEFGRRAVALDAEDPAANLALGRAYATAERYDSAFAVLQKALGLNPHFAAAHYSLGLVYIMTDRIDEGIDAVKKAMSLSPQDIWLGPFHSRLAEGYLAKRDYEAAVTHAEEAFRCAAPPMWPGKSYLVSALGHLGRFDEAQRALEELLVLRPGLTVDIIRSLPFRAVVGPAHLDNYLDGLRKAGLPE